MTQKEKNITELYNETLKEITSSSESWRQFLKSASMNYKRSFNDQVLIYAQRPEAVACETINYWNTKYNRWVKKYTKGIALLTEKNGECGLDFVFGIDDTQNRYGKSIYIWNVGKHYENDIIESLENSFGDLEEKNNIGLSIISATTNLVQDNLQDYLSDFNSVNEEIVQSILTYSISYMTINRCGFDPDSFIDNKMFDEITNFDNIDNILSLGLATNDISKMELKEISKTIRNLRLSEINKIRTFDNNNELVYDDNEKKDFERSDINELNLHNERGLRDTELNTREERQVATRKVQYDATFLSEEEQQALIHEIIDSRQTNRTPSRDSSDSRSESERDSREFSTERTSERGVENDRPNEMGRINEQLQSDSRGNNNDRTNLRLNIYEKDGKHRPYVVTDDKVNQILANTPHLRKSNKEIIKYFELEKDVDKRTKYLKDMFNSDFTGIIINDQMYGYKAYDNGLLLWKDNYLTSDTETFIEWKDLIFHYDSMILLHQLNDRTTPIPSISDQLSLIDSVEQVRPELEFSQEFVDIYLQEKHTETKYAIYEQFQNSLSTQENINYLKNLYGIGGSTHTIRGSGIGDSYDSKGITLTCGYSENEIKQLFTWNVIEKKIKELIRNDRYLNLKEKDGYSNWLDEEQNKRELREKENELSNFNDEIEEEKNYEYHLGDKVYIGAEEYEILSFDDESVRLYDYKWPLFNKELPRDEFDKKVKDNPCNDHLIVKEQEEAFYGEFNDEVDFMQHILNTHKIRDIELDFNDDEVIIAKDDDNRWIGKEFYDFVLDEVLVYQEDGSVNLLTNEELNKIRKYAKKYEVQEIQNDLEVKEELVPQFDKKTNSNKVKYFDLHPNIKNKDRNNYFITDDNLGVGTPKQKFRKNINAIKVLKLCENENRFATQEEQEVLSQYVGWGGLSEAFDEANTSWSLEHKELKEILSEKEYKDGMESTLTAFYTPPIVIRSMYQVLSNMGLKNGNILEPSCGIGNFLGSIPISLENCKLYGIELDSISGRIAQQLYQKSSIAVEGYEQTNLPDSFFDVAIGNVPFGDFKVNDKKYDKNNFLIHDYFFAKTLDKVRVGGVIAFITSKGTMDKDNPSVRKYIASRADLLDAIRLPDTTFKNNAGTEVTADIIFLQKRDSVTDIMPDWVYLDTDENNIKMNNYFINNPDMIMGKMEMQTTRFGMDSTCKLENINELESMLNNAISNIHGEVKEYEIDDNDEEDLSIEADITVKNFSYTLIDDKIYYRENSRMYPSDLPITTTNRVKGLIEIRDCVRTLIDMQLEDFPEEDIKNEQYKLNSLYDAFNKKYGLINSRGNATAFSNDSSYYLLCSLEIVNENGELVRKADMFSKRTIKPHIEIKSVDTASEALVISISEKARVDIDYIKKLTDKSEEDIVNELDGAVFRVPNTDNYVTADEYLSGNVRQKLLEAINANNENHIYESNVKHLKEIQPKDLSASEISVRLGATWLPVDVVNEFIYYILETNYRTSYYVKAHYSELTGEWNIEGKTYDRGNVKAYTTYGTNKANGYRIIEDTLNLKDIRIYDYEVDEEGKKTAILNKKETAIAQAKQELIKNKFDEWIWSDPDRRERLTNIYNEKFNSIRNREYDGSHISFGGINPEITLRTHQLNAIARILYGGNTLLAHEVGAGKTFEMVAAAMESKRLGLCNKSLFVVPNHIIEQFASEFLQLYPSANILVSTKKDFETGNRKKFCSRIATGDFDAVIIGHSQFERIPMSVHRQVQILEEQIKDITRGIQDLKSNGGEKFSIKQLMKTQKSIENKLEKLNDSSKKDDVVTFEELGVDRIFIDEAHYYKNLYLYTKMRNVGGIAQTEAQKSSDLFMKCRYLDELTNNKGVVFATGTPISNSMVELYTLQRYLQYDVLAEKKLQHFDAWASTFGETITAIELAPEGTGYRAKTRFAKFYNLPELMGIFKEVADIQTADMLNLPVPKANYENVVVNPSDIQKEMVESLAERAEKIRNKEVDSTEDNMLKVTNDGRKLALDQRLINELLPDYEDSKVSICANNIYNIWEQYKEDKLAQLVFCDLSTPHNDGSFNVYNDIKDKLLLKGIPEDDIEFIHNANTEVRKKELFAKVRRGDVRVLMGSTAKMGAGTNCQDKLIALHDLDCPWRPSDLIQRSGRIIRQGNHNKEVYIYRYVTEKTFDAYLYQLVENKQRFISQIMTSKTPIRSAEDIDETALSYAEIKALAAGNPLIIEKTELDTQVAKLKLLKQSHLSQIYEMEDKVLKHYPNEIKRLDNRIKNMEEDILYLKNNTQVVEGFNPMIIKGITYTEKAEAGKKILEECKKMNSPDPILLGKYKGFKMDLSFDSMSREFKLIMKNNLSYSVELGSDVHGNITRIDNVLNGIENNLELCKNQLENTKSQYQNAKQETDRPFPQEEELKSKSKRLDELNIILNLNKKENEIVDSREESENSQIYKRNYER